jgi:hypothetical protein
VNIAAIAGVPPPVKKAIPVTALTGTTQYTGTVAWNPTMSGTFAAETVYTATITLTAKSGYTLQGVAENFFTVAGATSVSNSANSGVVIAVFPQTAYNTVTSQYIYGVTAPVAGATPVTAISESIEYTGTVAWNPPVSGTFVESTVYTATITLTVKEGYSLQGVAENFFTLSSAPGGTSVSNAANSGVIQAVFPPAWDGSLNLGDTGPGGGKIFYKSVLGFTYYTSPEDETGVIAHYLEAASQDISPNVWWATMYNSQTNITGTVQAVGSGRRNTLRILAMDTGAPAALACKNLNQGDKNDWFLPSREELNWLYRNRTSVGNLGTGHYWSSSQGRVYTGTGSSQYRFAWTQYFGSGDQNDSAGKYDSQSTSITSVRPIRAFYSSLS